MYNEAKVLFVLWLWHSRTRVCGCRVVRRHFVRSHNRPLPTVTELSTFPQGAEYVYNTVIAPLLQRYETDIDRYLDEGKARVGDAVYTAYQRCGVLKPLPQLA